MSQGYERLSEIARTMNDAVSNGLVPTPEELTVREFLGWYEYAKRGAAIVSRIRNDLEKHHSFGASRHVLDLRTNPDFEVVWIDSTISIELQPDATDAPSSSEPVDPTQRIGSLEAANRKPMSVNPTDALSKATTKMQLNDYSRLPVMTNEASNGQQKA